MQVINAPDEPVGTTIILITGKTRRPPNWAPFQDQDGAGSGISGVYLCSNCTWRITVILISGKKTKYRQLEPHIKRKNGAIFKYPILICDLARLYTFMQYSVLSPQSNLLQRHLPTGRIHHHSLYMAYRNPRSQHQHRVSQNWSHLLQRHHIRQTLRLLSVTLHQYSVWISKKRMQYL